METFDIRLQKAISKCSGIGNSDDYHNFYHIYPFSTENIQGYLPYFDVKDKKALTVGSSLDQVIELGMCGCYDQTVIDVCPNTKEYFYLKVAGLLRFNRKQFLNFFRYMDYPDTFLYNSQVFSKEGYYALRDTLRLLDYESFLFWDELFHMFSGKKVRLSLFTTEEYGDTLLQQQMSYLHDDESFDKVKDIVTNIHFQFIQGDLIYKDFDTNLLDSYDFIHLSNIGKWNKVEDVKAMANLLNPHLNISGNMVLCYLYNTQDPYETSFHPIYNLERDKEILGEYFNSFYSFLGIDGIKFKDNKTKDSVMVYSKK